MHSVFFPPLLPGLSLCCCYCCPLSNEMEKWRKLLVHFMDGKRIRKRGGSFLTFRQSRPSLVLACKFFKRFSPILFLWHLFMPAYVQCKPWGKHSASKNPTKGRRRGTIYVHTSSPTTWEQSASTFSFSKLKFQLSFFFFVFFLQTTSATVAAMRRWWLVAGWRRVWASGEGWSVSAASAARGNSPSTRRPSVRRN